MATPADYRFLEWDSQHFGLRIGSSRWYGGTADLLQILGRAREDALNLLYLFAPPGIELPQEVLSQLTAVHRSGRVEFCKNVQFERTAEPLSRDNIVVLTKESPIGDRLRQIAILAGKYSRFLTDPRVPKTKGEDLFTIWAERSLAGEIADGVLGAIGPAGQLQGFVTLSQEGTSARIGLIAVEPQEQGRGHGKKLLASAEAWSSSRGLGQLRVATQTENTGACEFYLRNGFQQQKSLAVYHLWLT